MQLSLQTLAMCDNEQFGMILQLAGVHSVQNFARTQYNEASLLLTQMKEKKINEPEIERRLQDQYDHAKVLLGRFPVSAATPKVRTKAGLKRILSYGNK